MDRVASVSTLISKIFETRFLIGQDSRFARSPIYLDIVYFSEIELVQMDRVASVSRLIFKMVNVFVPVNGEKPVFTSVWTLDWPDLPFISTLCIFLR